MKEFSCHKYIVINNQETCFPDYILTDKYYSCKEFAEKDWNDSEHCFCVIKALRMTKQTGQIAITLTRHEWCHK